MLRYFLLFIAFLFNSCAEYAEKPEHLMSKNELAEVIAELAINQEASFKDGNLSSQEGGFYIMKQYGVSPEALVGSFRYYTANKDIDGILEKAKRIVREKHPEAEAFIQNKQTKNGEVEIP